MRESDYIILTNLVKYRLAESILREITPRSERETEMRRRVVTQVAKEVQALERLVESRIGK